MKFQVGDTVKIKYQDLISVQVAIIVMIMTMLQSSFGLKVVEVVEKEGDNPENDSQILTIQGFNGKTFKASNFFFELEYR